MSRMPPNPKHEMAVPIRTLKKAPSSPLARLPSLLLIIILFLLPSFTNSSSPSFSKMMWSVQPLSQCAIKSLDVWENVPDTNVTMTLGNELPMLIR